MRWHGVIDNKPSPPDGGEGAEHCEAGLRRAEAASAAQAGEVSTHTVDR
jgi:hypothetical protein